MHIFRLDLLDAVEQRVKGLVAVYGLKGAQPITLIGYTFRSIGQLGPHLLFCDSYFGFGYSILEKLVDFLVYRGFDILKVDAGPQDGRDTEEVRVQCEGKSRAGAAGEFGIDQPSVQPGRATHGRASSAE